MRTEKKRQIKIFSIMTSFMMIFSLIIPVVSSADSNGKLNQSINDTKSVAKNKVSDRLLNVFKDDEEVTFLIKFKDKADTKMAAKDARSKAEKQSVSAYKSNLMQRSAVVSALKATAYESQQNVMQYLEKEKDNGNAENIRSYFIVNGIAVTASKKVAEKVATFREVEKILPNETRQLFQSEANKKTTSNTKIADVEWNVKRIGAPEMWKKGIDGTGTVIATIDTGVQWDHPALKEKYRGYDASTGEVDHNYSWYDAVFYEDEPYDDIDHGTHVTGTMVGSEANGANQIGVAPGAKWIAVKAFSHAGGFDADLLDAAEWIIAPTDEDGNERIDMAPDVVNNSWGGGPGLDEWYRDVVIAWRSAQIFPEFSAGNKDLFNPGGPGSIVTPANYPESFATGATDEDDVLGEFSLLGPSPYDEIKPDISAPGVDIRSSIPGNGYELFSGTSMAGPAVSAVAAMLRQINGSLSVDDMEDILLETATPMTDETYPESPNNGYGYGLVNASDAVSSLIDGFGDIEGIVTQVGEDDKPPTYKHDPIKEAYPKMDLDLKVEASDNTSVTSVILHYQMDGGEEQTLEAERISGDYLSGQYAVQIPGDQIKGETLTYQWIINDFSQNETVTDAYVVDIKTEGISIGYSEDFETEPVGWSSFGREDSWEWGVPTSGPNGASSGEKVYATNLNGNYPPVMDATLMMPQITLPEGDAFLQFEHWHSYIEPLYPGESDYGYVVISTDPEHEEWKTLQTIQGKSNGWESVEVDLSDYSGQTIFVGFKTTSDYFYESDGWYIDDVALTDTSVSSIENPLGLFKINSAKTEIHNEVNDTLLPLDAKVSVIESGRFTATDPGTGAYSLYHETGTYTVQAEAYGFQSAQKNVAVDADNTISTNFTLQELQQFKISGKITNEVTGDPVDEATLLLIEDANVAPVESDSEGNYEMHAYKGAYTLKVIAPNYHSKEIEVDLNDGNMELSIELEPFYTYPGGEIGYDDGTAENARAFYDAGNGWAVKMSLPEGKDSAIVTDGVFKFWGDEFPSPGGTAFVVEVWDASGKDGLPGKKIAGPIEGEAIRDETDWTVVDLTEHAISVDGDFYMVYIQTSNNTGAPGLATDESSPNANRSYQYVGGAWEQSPADEGNYMIRARVSYEIDSPVITSPEDGLLTNESEVTVEGTASPTTTVQLMNNDEEVASAEVGDDGEFSIPATMTEGENVFTAVSTLDGSPVGESNPVTVVLDTEAPDLTIDNPKDGDKINRETVTVEGTVTDENLDFVEVNGQKANVEDGSYSKRILLDNGENTIEVVAEDGAGNSTTESVTIQVKYDAPEIEHLTPTEDVTIEAGESVKIEFDSEPGLKASFFIHMPLTNAKANTANATELPMMETSEGHYVGYWTATKNAYAEGAVLEVKAVDGFKNETRKQAEGKLFINVD